MIALITSCSTSTVEEDVDAYCQCVQKMKSDQDKKRCNDLAQEMLDKYSYDPRAADYIETHVKDCASSNQ